MRIVSFILVIFTLFSLSFTYCFAEEESVYQRKEELVSLAEGVIKWKSNSLSSEDKSLYIKLSPNAGSTASDWYAFALARLKITDGSEYYTDHLRLYTENKYKEKDKLSQNLATEWHRIAVTAIALGADATSFGVYDGNKIDLIKDGVYDRGLTAELSAQGISGYIWGLITLDTVNFSVPESAYTTREEIITEIMKRQLPDGGFALAGKVSDPDVTAMTVTALSSYIGSRSIYEYVRAADALSRSVTVSDIVSEAVTALSNMQAENGEYRSYGQANVKSACQVVTALCSVGVDIFSDERFIKNGETLLDVILRYKNSDGGFSSYLKDGAASDSMSGEQVLYTISALIRFIDGERKLFDLSEDFSDDMKQRLAYINNGIASLFDSSSYDTVYALLTDYCALPVHERDYVYGAQLLTDKAVSLGINVEETDEKTEKVPDNSEEKLPDNNATSLPDEYLSFIKSLEASMPESTESYSMLLIIRQKLEENDSLEDRDSMLSKVNSAILHVEGIMARIDRINNGIAEIVGSSESENSADKTKMAELIREYEALSPYDKLKITDYERLLSAYTREESSDRTDTVLYVSLGTALVLTLIVGLRIRARRIRKKKEETYFE